MKSSMKRWKRWDPRLTPKVPTREVTHYEQWAIEVVPDLFAPGQEALHAEVFRQIEAVRERYRGRYILRTAHPAAAKAALAKLSETYTRGPESEVPSRCVLAVYAETKAELLARVAELREPRPSLKRLAMADPEAAIELAIAEGHLSTGYGVDRAREALAESREKLGGYLADTGSSHRRTDHTHVDSGGLALYLSPREPLDLGAPGLLVAPPVAQGYVDGEYTSSICGGADRFEWVICAGRVGPIDENSAGSHPLHPEWIAEIVAVTREAGIPLCVPTLGEWSPEKLSGAARMDVDYDTTWKWGERGWGPDNRTAKPSTAYMQAVGSALSGRTVDGRIFDDWPDTWYER